MVWHRGDRFGEGDEAEMRPEESQLGGSQRAGLSGVITVSWILEDTGKYMHAVLEGVTEALD